MEQPQPLYNFRDTLLQLLDKIPEDSKIFGHNNPATLTLPKNIDDPRIDTSKKKWQPVNVGEKKIKKNSSDESAG